MFEIVEDAPSGAQYKMKYIRCMNCKTFLQAEPFYDTTFLLQKIQEDMDKMKTFFKIPDKWAFLGQL